jgi:hypothetical protein
MINHCYQYKYIDSIDWRSSLPILRFCKIRTTLDAVSIRFSKGK